MLLKFCLSSILISTLLLAVNGIPQQTIAAGSQVGLQIGAGASYRGKYIGPLQPRQHKVSGEVYAVDARTLHIKGFTYSGTDAFFWTGFTENPSSQGIIVPDEKGSKEVLGAYNNQDITITLPDGLTLRDIKWFGVWCRQYEVNFGDLYIPADFDFPQPHVIGSLAGQHGVSSGPIVVIDAQTILVPDFSYDGQAPDVHFWVGKGKPGPEGARVPSDTGGEEPLVKSDKKTMVLSLPGDLTIFDIDFFGVWCRLYYVDFGHVKIPPMINVPPSLRMLNLTPQTKLNCEVMYDDLALEVRWSVAAESIVLQLVGRIEPGHYMSFGLSGDDSRSSMIGGDVVVAWVDENGHGHVVDYYLESKAQCAGNRGSCPDTRLQVGNNNVRLLSATVVNGFTMITLQRPLRANDQLDKTILTNASQPIIFASGPLNQRSEVSYHSIRNREDIFIDFGRSPKWNCPKPDNNEPSTSASTPASTTSANYYGTNQNSKTPADEPNPYESKLHNVKTHSHHLQQTQTQPKQQQQQQQQQKQKHQQLQPVENSISSRWEVPAILCHEPEDRVFYAQMGPTGGKRGYNAITGQIGWGIAWYINGLLIPEITVVRGRTYTFVVEGGDNPEIPARYHPFYITDDPEGSYQHKSRAEKSRVNAYAGISVDEQGNEYPTSTGRLCQWTENSNQHPDTFPSYGSYQRSLSLQCDDGNPGILHWTPDKNTPDLVYYQCYTHRYLGWKIHVVDSCDTEPSKGILESPLLDLDQEIGESIQNTAVSPHPNDLNQNQQTFTTGRPFERYPASLHQHQPHMQIQQQQQYPHSHQQHIFHSQQPQFHQQQQIQIHHEENNRPRAPQIIRLNEHQNPSLQHYQMRHPVKIQPEDLFNYQREQPLILSSNGQQNIFKGFSPQQQQQNHRQQQHPLRHVLPPASSNWGQETQSLNNQPKVRLSPSGGSPQFFASTIPSQLAAGSAQSAKIIAIPYHHPSEISSRIPPQHHHHQNQPKRIRQQQQQKHGENEGLKLLNISPPIPIPPIQLHHHIPLRPSSNSNSHNSNNNNNNNRRNPNSWASHQQTRNLLKREEFGKELLKGLDDGSLEIVKLGDNENIPFEIPSQEEIMRNVYNNNDDDDQIDESSSQFLHVIKDLSTQKKMMSSSNKSKASYSTQKRVEIKSSGDQSKPSMSSHQGDLKGPPVQSFEPIFIPSPPDVSQNQKIPVKTKNKVAQTKAVDVVQRKSLSPSAAVNLRVPHALKQISVNNLNRKRNQPVNFELPQVRMEEEDDEYEDDYYNYRIRQISQLNNKRNKLNRRMDSPMMLRKRLGVAQSNPPSGIRRDDHIYLAPNSIPLAQIQQHLQQQQKQNNQYRLVDPHNHQFHKRRYYDGQPPHQMVLRQQSTFPSRSGLNHQLLLLAGKTRPNNNLNSKKFQSPLLPPISFGNNRETFLRYPETLNQQRDPQRAPNNFPPILPHPHYVRRNFPNTQKNLQSQSQNWRSAVGDPQLFLVPAADELYSPSSSASHNHSPNSRKESLKNQFPHNLQQREKEFRRVDGEPAGVRTRPLVNTNVDLQQQTERRKWAIIRPRIEETLKNSQKSEKSPDGNGGATTTRNIGGLGSGGAAREREKEMEQIPSEISDEKVTIRKTQKQQKVKPKEPIIEESERENRDRERSKNNNNNTNNNTDLHILTDIWSIINNQEEQRGKSPVNSNNNNSKMTRFDNPKRS